MKYSKAQGLHFAVLCLRWYLAFYMINYGWGKLHDGQFGLANPDIAEQPLKQIDRFYLAWYLFSLSKFFNVVVGLSQIAGGLLLLFEKTVLLGAFLVLPILGQIFLIDMSFTVGMFGYALPLRLAGMILADMLILAYHRRQVLLVWNALTAVDVNRFHYAWPVYLCLPLIGFLMDFAIALLTLPIRMLLNIPGG